MRKTGIFCMILGALCLLGAVGLLVYNQWEAEAAAQTSQTLLQDVQAAMEASPPSSKGEEGQTGAYGEALPEHGNVPNAMATIRVEDYDCIGVLRVPVLELELPVLTEWSYAKLKKAPCLYYGSYYAPNFVIAAHNYTAHFGRLSELQPGDPVIFTDVNGVSYNYEVVLLETLPGEATEEMIASGFDLSLYTCTLGGGSRVTVRCIRK